MKTIALPLAIVLAAVLGPVAWQIAAEVRYDAEMTSCKQHVDLSTRNFQQQESSYLIICIAHQK